MTTLTPNNLPVRSGKGRWRKSLASWERDAEACRMYTEGKTYQEISDTLGYGDKGNAYRAIQRVLMKTIEKPARELRALLWARNQEIYIVAREIALREHYAYSAGKLVTNNGTPVIDRTPQLGALDRMQRALAEMAKLCGAHAPIKIEKVSLEAVQAEIARLEQEVREAGETI